MYRPWICEDQTDSERLIENVEGSSTGGFRIEIDNLQIGVNVVDKVDNAKLKKYLTRIEEIMPVSCPIVSVEKRAEEIVDGGTLEETKAMLPCGEESVGELGEEGCAEKNDAKLNNGSSTGIRGANSEIVDRAKSADGGRENEILEGCEAMVFTGNTTHLLTEYLLNNSNKKPSLN